jgi:Fe2+ transport system protein FeoA
MLITDSHIGKTLKISDVPQKLNCENCDVCVRLRIMELGLYEGEYIRIDGHTHGLWRLQILNEKGVSISSLALRDEEMERVFVEDDCLITFSV